VETTPAKEADFSLFPNHKNKINKATILDSRFVVLFGGFGLLLPALLNRNSMQ
jgi:hypothetical protein